MSNDNSISSDLIRGHIDTIILRSLYDGDKHNNEICLDIEDKSGGQYELKQPTLYSALKRLENAGLIHAYWSSSVGQRRRYYKLTDEGRRVCDENFDIWVYSRNIIDKLISNGTDLRYPDYSAKPAKPKFDISEYENYTFDAGTDETEFVEPDEPVPEVEDTEDLSHKAVLKSEDDSDIETRQQARENEDNLSNLEAQDSEDVAVTQLSLIEEPVIESEEPEEPQADDAEEEDTDEEIIIEYTSLEDESAVDTDTDTDEANAEETDEETDEETAVETPAEPETESEPEPEPEPPIPPSPSENISDEDDDSLIIEPYTTLEKRYTDILESLYPDRPPVTHTTVEFPENTDDSENAEENKTDDEPEPIAEPAAVTFYAEEKREEEKPVPQKPVAEKPKNPNEIDYTDIISVGKMQGIRIKPSDRTNRVLKGKLLINRLVSLSAALLYAIMIAEMLVICLSANHILKFGVYTFLYIALGLAAFPLIACLIVIIAPNATVNKLPTMRYSVSAAFVAMLNLILLTFAVVLLLRIDLFAPWNLFVYVLLPIVLYLNIPLYFCIKYLLVSSGIFIKEE